MLVFTGVGIRDVTAVTILCNRLLDGEIQPSARFQVLLAMFVEIKVLCRVRITQWWLIHLPTFRESVVFSILLDCLTLNMEALGHSRTPIATQRSRRCNIREGLNFHPASSLMWRRSITAKEEEWHFTKFWLAHVLTTKVTVRLCPDVLATFLFISCAGICRNFISTLLLFFSPSSLGKLQRLQFLFITKENIYFFFQWCDGLLVMCLLESSAASRFLSSRPSLCLTLPIPLCVQFGMYSHYNLELPLLHVMWRDAGLENKSVQCLLLWLGLLGAIKSGLEQIRIFSFSLYKFGLLQEVSLVTSLLLPHRYLSL